MRIGFWLSSLSLLAALAQQPPAPPGAPSPSPQPEVKSEDQCTVKGIVLNARTGEPLARAQVRLVRLDGGGAAPNATTTDASGRFNLNGVPPGQYRATAARNGFVRQASKSGQTPPPLTLTPNQTVDGLTLNLIPAGVITGHVVDEYGEPLANVQLQPFQYVSVSGERQFMPLGGAASTDDRGAYRIFGLNSGRYYISAAYSETAGWMGGSGRGGRILVGGPAPAAADESYPPVFYPGVADPAQAAPIQLHAGEERQGVDFRLATVRAIRVRGYISPVPARPREVLVMLTPRGGWGAATFSMGPRPPVQVDARGAFEVSGVTPGSYLLTAMVNRDGSPHWARLPVEAGSGDIDGLELAFRPNVDVKGRVRFDGDPQPGLDLTSLSVTLTPLVASMGFAGSMRSALDLEGSFELRNVGEGDYRISIDPLAGDAYVKTMKYGGADAAGKALSVGEAPGTLEVVLSAGGARVEGVVTEDDKPAAGALVTVVPDSGRADLRKVGRTGQNGRYSVGGLAPGDYTVYAFDDVPEVSSTGSDGLKEYQDKARKITVEEKGRATADLTLIHTRDE